MPSNIRSDFGSLLLRVGVGAVAAYFGAQKLLGAFGGHGVQETLSYFKSQMSIPPVLAILAMCAEFFGGLGLIVGFLTPIAAFGLACTMAVASYESWKAPDMVRDVFVKGIAEKSDQGFLAPLLFCGAVAILLNGAGGFSLDTKFPIRGKKAK